MSYSRVKNVQYIFIIFTFFLFGFCYAQNGTLDTSFGTNGIVSTTNGVDQEVFYAIIEADNDKILAAGTADYIATLIRYNNDGTIDTTFGTNGILSLDFGGDREEIEDLLMQPDGKILIAAETRNSNGDYDFIVARLNNDGSYDTSFGTNGFTVVTFGSSTDERPDGLLLTPDGKIIVAGNTEGGLIWQMGICRLNTDGSLDTSFSNDGLQTLNITNRSDYFNDVDVTFDNKIIAAGGAVLDSGSNQGRFAVVRYQTNGDLDTSFADNGFLVLNIQNGACIAESIISLPDGKSLVAGYSSGTENTLSFAIIRLDINGDLDPTFGDNGSVVTVFPGGSSQIYKMKLDDDNNIYAVGRASLNGGAEDFAVAKYSFDGVLDTNFGTSGLVTTDFFGSFDRAWDVLIQDSKLTLAGFTMQSSPDEDFALARYDLDDNLNISEENYQNQIEIYPTIIDSNITVKANNGIFKSEIFIIDIQGKTVLETSTTIHSIPKTIDLKTLTKGVYFVKIQTKNQTETHKIVKQ